MAQDTFADFNAASSSNSTIEGDATDGSVNVAEGCAIGNINNAVRALQAACNLSFGDLPSGTSRPAYLAAGKDWKDTTTATAPIIKHYDGSDDITVLTYNYTTNSVTFAGAMANIVEDTTPQLGGDLDLNGNGIVLPGATVTDVTGADTLLVSGTAGTSGNLAQWNADGDAVDASIATSAVATLTGSQTLTNKTIILTNAAGAAPTTDGEIKFDRTGENLEIGDGSGTKIFSHDGGTATLSGKTIDSANNTLTLDLSEGTLTGTLAEFNTAISDNNITPVGQIAGFTAKTGTSENPALSDIGKVITMNNASANTLTIQTNATVAFSIGDWFSVIQIGAGTTTVTGDTGVTVNGVSGGGAESPFKYAFVTCIKVGTNEWYMNVDGVA